MHDGGSGRLTHDRAAIGWESGTGDLSLERGTFLADHVEYCGEEYPLDTNVGLVIGREGDLAIDDNPYLHRHFLRVHSVEGLWWLANIGSQLTVTVADGASDSGAYLAYLASGAQLPLVFPQTIVRFSAGATTYELSINLDDAVFVPPPITPLTTGETTAGGVSLTPEQRLLLLALTERALRSGNRSPSTLPTSAEAARRLGWTLTKFNRKLDNVCQKLARAGVQGLHGGPDQLASSRRYRLVEYAIAARLVDVRDLPLLDDRELLEDT